MYILMDKDIALRSWWFVPHAFMRWHDPLAGKLSREEFELLRLADAEHDLEPGETLQGLLDRGLAHEVARGEGSLSGWQRPLAAENRYVPTMQWMITTACNFNCLHCFNAADAERQFRAVWEPEESERLLAEAHDAGVAQIDLTGGEPLVHPHFMDYLRGVYEHGMYVDKINTNGSLLTEGLLAQIREIDPLIRVEISFDGLGTHDWLRNRTGAEEEALAAIRRVVGAGLTALANMNLNRRSAPVLLPTLELLDKIGVTHMRVIPTTPAPRWEANAHGESLASAEYYDLATEAMGAYAAGEHAMGILFWQFARIEPAERFMGITGVSMAGNGTAIEGDGEAGPGRGPLDRPFCTIARRRIGVSANGEVYPCVQMGGWYTAHGRSFGNVRREGLVQILRGGDWMRAITAKARDVTGRNEKCRSCEHLSVCCGGCRALGILTSGGDFAGADETKCTYFNGPWRDRLLALAHEHGYDAAAM